MIGGPPCQAYSVAGRVRKDMTDDPRNHLYKHYVEFLKKYQPKMFVFENVPGILTAKNGHYLQLIFDAVREAGYELDKKVLNAQDFGVLQDRKRVIIIGWKNNLDIEYPEFDKGKVKFEIAKHLFSDLPKIKSGQGQWGVSNYVQKSNDYLEASGIRNGINFTTQHISRFNNDND